MKQPAVTVAELLKSRPETTGVPLELLGGKAGLGRVIRSPHIQKTGLALAGFHDYLHPFRVVVFGESEARYFEALNSDERMSRLTAVFTREVPCVLITGGWSPPSELLTAADRHDIPLLRTTIPTPRAIAGISNLLDDVLAVREIVHGVLMDVMGLGVLIVGASSIGKSECALDLVVRGHRLVADDTVEVRRRGESVLIGTCPELTRYHMEIRGLGVINVRDLYGVAAIRASKRVELVVQLERWDSSREYDRLGLDDRVFELLSVKIPLIRIPVAPGRSLAILVEVAARNQLLRSRGRHAAQELASKLDDRLRESTDEADIEDDADDGGRE